MCIMLVYQHNAAASAGSCPAHASFPQLALSHTNMTTSFTELGRRERQIMDILVRRGRATAAEVLEDLADAPSYSAVRSMLRLLEEKGYVRHEWEGPRYIFLPTGDPEQLKQHAVRHLLETFFNNSTESAVVAMLGASPKSLTSAELDRLADLIKKTKKKGARR
jgi:BlaI family transcriptional regulator, penicillinase repressor